MIIAPMTRRTAFLPFAAILLLGGCFLPHPDEPAGDAPMPPARQAALAKEEADLAAAMQTVAGGKVDYRLAPADLVAVAVSKAPEMNRKVRVDSNGNVPLTLLGPIKIGGLTLDEAKARIEGKLAKYLIDPRISLSIEAYGSKTIFVMGEVQNPGAYALPPDSRVLVPDAVRTAGGFTPAAASNRARLLRYVEGQSVTFTVTQDVILEPNDVVFIPRNDFSPVE